MPRITVERFRQRPLRCVQIAEAELQAGDFHLLPGLETGVLCRTTQHQARIRVLVEQQIYTRESELSDRVVGEVAAYAIHCVFNRTVLAARNCHPQVDEARTDIVWLALQ